LATLIVLTLGAGVAAAFLKDTTPKGSIAQPTASATFSSPATSSSAPSTSPPSQSPTGSASVEPSETRTQKPEVPEMPRTGVDPFVGLGLSLLALGYLLGRWRRAPEI
jgi:hypothetical protein